ncbi:sugar phosphate isomerase/epimerase family protein [Lentisphaera araneosa]|jgi:D-psicose/D-tagatose/L-ribulose 3-epimerase|nr:sugar phosphate isomerase/epimerase [Lentisphaera araneosa]
MDIYMNFVLWTTHVSEQEFTLFKELKDMGYTGVEIPVFGGEREHYQKMGKAIKEVGLKCIAVTCVGADNDPASHLPEVQEEGLNQLKWAVDMCTELGATLLVGPFYAAHGKFDIVDGIDECRKRSAKVVKSAAQYAQTKGITFSLEFLNRFEIFLLNCASDTSDYLKLVDEENVGILYDTHHANIEEKSITETFAKYGHQFNHIHFSESHRGILGDGQVNWQETKEALAKIDYKGDVAIEAFAHDLPGFSEVAHVWRALFDSKLDLCKSSISFVKETFK